MSSVRVVVIATVVAVTAGCPPIGSGGPFFFGSTGAVPPSATATDDKQLTLHVDFGAPPQIFDIEVESDAEAFFGFVEVGVVRASAPFGLIVADANAPVNNLFEARAGEVRDASLGDSGFGVTGFTLGVVAADAAADIDLDVVVSVEFDGAGGDIEIGALQPRAP